MLNLDSEPLISGMSGWGIFTVEVIEKKLRVFNPGNVKFGL
jgi:hypothetical protein